MDTRLVLVHDYKQTNRFISHVTIVNVHYYRFKQSSVEEEKEDNHGGNMGKCETIFNVM